MRPASIVPVLALAGLGLGVSACGGDGGTTKAATAPPATTTAPSGTLPPDTAPSTAPGASGPVPVKVADTSLGRVLASADGHTLYRFDPDRNGRIACVGGCTKEWPPLVATGPAPSSVPGAPGTFAVASRPDGTRQVTYDGAPLYRYVDDERPGDTKGDGEAGVWHAVRVGAAAPSTPSPTGGGGGGYGY